MRRLYTLLFCFCLFISCLHKKEQIKNKTELSSDRTVTVTLNRFWGGMPTAELERKKEKDLLTCSYQVRNGQQDSTVYSSKPIEKSTADSIFAAADKINFNPDNVYGSSDDKTGMKAIISLKKKKIPQSVTFLRLKDISELPPDVQNLVILMNRIAPGDFKLY